MDFYDPTLKLFSLPLEARLALSDHAAPRLCSLRPVHVASCAKCCLTHKVALLFSWNLSTVNFLHLMWNQDPLLISPTEILCICTSTRIWCMILFGILKNWELFYIFRKWPTYIMTYNYMIVTIIVYCTYVTYVKPMVLIAVKSLEIP